MATTYAYTHGWPTQPSHHRRDGHQQVIVTIILISHNPIKKPSHSALCFRCFLPHIFLFLVIVMSEDVEMTDIDMGYEEAAPMPRRGSMSQEEEKERRASIKAIMADDTISPMAKRRSIQHLMDGRRNSLENARRNSLENARRSSMSGAIAVPTNHSTSAHSYHSTGSSAGDAHEFENGGGSGDYPYPNNVPFGENGNMQQYGYDDTSQLPNANGVFAISNEFTRRTEQTRPYCSHYERNCTIIAPCCGAAFGCRICHDDCPVLPPKINNGGKRYHRSASLPSSFTDMGPKEDPVDPNETHHNIDRFAIREVICRECFTRQSSKTYVFFLRLAME